MGRGFSVRTDSWFRLCWGTDERRLAAQGFAARAAQLQRRRRDRPGIVRAFNLAPRTLISTIGNPLAPLGPGAARRSLVILFLFLYALAAFAHKRGGEAIGFASGFEHPISGLDHILAMVAVGMWGAQLGAPAMWVLPVVFPMVMALGGMMGLMGIKLPGIELCIALSALALGFAVFREARPKLWIAAIIVGFFAIAHGHAHGTELPLGASGVLYSIGFVIATGLLHALGIGTGLIHRWPAGRIALRFAGAIVAMGGVFFLWKAISGEAV